MTEVELMTELINRRGYLVVGTSTECKLGGTLSHDPPMENAFVIISPTTRADADEQNVLVSELKREPIKPWPDFLYFYRVGTD